MSQNREDFPYFPCYANRILADKRYKLMSPEERFLWISIYLECWPNRSVPADPVELAKYLGYPIEAIKAGLTERVLSFFKEVKGELISPQLEEYWGTIAIRLTKQSEGGKKGANRRYNKDLEDIGQPIGTPIPQHIGQPSGEPIGPSNQIKSSQVKSNPSPIKELGVDPWLAEYEAASNESVAGPKKVRRTV